MSRRRTTLFIVLSSTIAAAGLLTACEDTTGIDGDAGVDRDGEVAGDARLDPNDIPLPEGLVSSAAAGGTVELTVAAAEEKFLVIPYSVSRTASEGISFVVNVEAVDNGTGSSEAKLSEWRRTYRPLRDRDPRQWRLVQAQQRVERWTRRLNEYAATMPMVAPATGQQFIQANGCQRSAECGALEVCLTSSQTCSDTVELDTSRFSDNAAPLTVEVLAKGEGVAILVDSTVASQVSSDDLEALTTAFDEKIYPRDVALFGNPPLKAGEDTLSTDRNADGLVWLVLTPRVSDKQAAVGFFIGTDFLVQGEGDGEDPSSNEADILYAMPPGSGDTQLADLLPTMAHEFQHLLNFAVKQYRAEVNGGTGALEALWLDEGLSHLAEDLCGYGAGNVTLLQEETIPAFSETSLIPPLDDDGNQVDSRPMRGMSLLFLRYLFERKGGVRYQSDGSIIDQGGAAWLASLRQTSAQGRDAVEQTYGDFQTSFERWLLTVGLDNRGVTDSPLLNYGALVTDPTPPENLIGLRIGATLTDPSGESVTLDRPLEDPLALGETDDVIPSTSAKYFVLTATTGTAKVSVTSDDNDFFFAVVKLD